MTHPNLDLINQFFAAYGQHDLAGIRAVMAEDVTWTFPGHHPISGVKRGIAEVASFFDAVGIVMGSSNVQVEPLVSGVNDGYVVETQRIRTNRADGNNLDQFWCVLWRFADGKIVEGRHFPADQEAADAFFKSVA